MDAISWTHKKESRLRLWNMAVQSNWYKSTCQHDKILIFHVQLCYQCSWWWCADTIVRQDICRHVDEQVRVLYSYEITWWVESTVVTDMQRLLIRCGHCRSHSIIQDVSEQAETNTKFKPLCQPCCLTGNPRGNNKSFALLQTKYVQF